MSASELGQYICRMEEDARAAAYPNVVDMTAHPRRMGSTCYCGLYKRLDARRAVFSLSVDGRGSAGDWGSVKVVEVSNHRRSRNLEDSVGQTQPCSQEREIPYMI